MCYSNHKKRYICIFKYVFNFYNNNIIMVSLKCINLTIKIILHKNIFSCEYFTHINVIINIQEFVESKINFTIVVMIK